MGKDKWAKVIDYLKKSNRNPDKVLKLLKGGDKETIVESSYNINRSSYSRMCIAQITQMELDPKNKGKTRTQLIRNWVNTKDFKDFYNLIRTNEKLRYDKSLVEKYVKQIKDLWSKPSLKADRNYFAMTKGKVIIQTGPVGSKIRKQLLKSKLYKR